MFREEKAWMSAPHLDRRSVLKAGGSLVVAFGVRMDVAAAADFAPVPANQLDSWIAIAEDGKVTAFTGRIDMGTGTQTVYCQAIAEELDIPVESVSVVLGDTALTPEQGKSTASDSVSLNLKPRCARPPQKRAACCSTSQPRNLAFHAISSRRQTVRFSSKAIRARKYLMAS